MEERSKERKYKILHLLLFVNIFFVTIKDNLLNFIIKPLNISNSYFFHNELEGTQIYSEKKVFYNCF